MKGIKKLKAEDLTAIMVQLKIVGKMFDTFNAKYHADLHITGLDTIIDGLNNKIVEIDQEPEIDPFSGHNMRGKVEIK